MQTEALPPCQVTDPNQPVHRLLLQAALSRVESALQDEKQRRTSEKVAAELRVRSWLVISRLLAPSAAGLLLRSSFLFVPNLPVCTLA